MKKVISVFLIVVLTFSFVIAASAAGIKFKINISSEVSQVKPGDQFVVSFMMTDVTDSDGIVGLDMYIEYDADKLEAISKENIFPTQWDKPGDFSPAFGVGVLEMHLLYDGEKTDNSISVFKDNELGVKVTFKAKENASGLTTIKLRGGDELSAASNSLETVFGEANLLTVSISSSSTTAAPTSAATTTTETSAATQSEAVTTKATATDTFTQADTSSAETTADTDVTETPLTTDTIIVNTDASETSDGDTTEATDTSEYTDASGSDETTADETGVIETTEEDAGPVNTSENTGDTTNPDKNGNKTIAILGIIALVVLAAVAALVILKYKKGQNKINDNPVNPG